MAVVRIAVERGDPNIGRPALKGRNAAVGDAIVAEVLVGERDLRSLVRHDGGRRIDSVALEIYVLPEAVGVLIHAIETDGELVVNRLVEIGREPLRAVRAAHQA